MHTTGLREPRPWRRDSGITRRRDRRKSSFGTAQSLRISGNPVREIQFLICAIVATLFFLSPALAQDGEAKVRMVHLSPDAPAVRVTVDGEEVPALSDVAYLDATPYLPLPAGPHTLAVYAVGDDSEPVLEVEVNPESGKSYTVAGVGLLADETFGARLFEDEVSKPEDGKAKVRVVHAIPDVGPATVSVADGGPELFALPGFANASNYVEVDPGTYTLDVTPSGADAPAFSVPDVAVEAGQTYTAFAIGQAADGSVGTIITEDSADGEIVARTGAAAEAAAAEAAEAAAAEAEAAAAEATSSSPESAESAEYAEASASSEVAVAPVAPEAAHPEPAAVVPVAAEPVAAAPVTVEPVYEEPIYAAPVHPEPVAYAEPVYTYVEPVYSDPYYSAQDYAGDAYYGAEVVVSQSSGQAYQSVSGAAGGVVTQGSATVQGSVPIQTPAVQGGSVTVQPGAAEGSVGGLTTAVSNQATVLTSAPRRRFGFGVRRSIR